jgi:hypothetical protein
LDKLDSGEHDSSVLKGFEAQRRRDPELSAAMILFDDVVLVLRGANLHWIRAEEVEVTSYTHSPECTMTWLEAIERDATRLSMTFQCLAEEQARCRLVAGLAKV